MNRFENRSIIIPVLNGVSKRKSGIRSDSAWLDISDVGLVYVASSVSTANLTFSTDTLVTRLNSIGDNLLRSVGCSFHVADGTSILDYNRNTGVFFFQFFNKCVKCITEKDEYVFPVLINNSDSLTDERLVFESLISDICSPAILTYSKEKGLVYHQDRGSIISTDILDRYKDRTFYALTCGSYKKRDVWFDIRGSIVILAENNGETIVLNWNEFIKLLRQGLLGVSKIYGLNCESEKKMKLWNVSAISTAGISFPFINSDIVMVFNRGTFIFWSDGIVTISKDMHYTPRVSEYGTPVVGSGCDVKEMKYNEVLRLLC